MSGDDALKLLRGCRACCYMGDDALKLRLVGESVKA